MKLFGLRTEAFKLLLFLGLITIALLLRTVNLGEFHPIDLDEKTWLMVGTSLIDTGQPTTWSIFVGAYSKAGADINTESVTPYLDHPPLFSLLVGGWAHFWGETDTNNLNWELVRVPMIVISLATIILTYLFVRRAFGKTMALFTLTAFVFFPSHVISSRIIAAEHMIGLLLMLGLYLFAVFATTKNERVKKVTGGAMIFLCLVSLLFKLSAIVVPATLCFLALYKRQWKLGTALSLASLASVLIYMGYGYYYNWEAFVNVLFAHQVRPQSFVHFWTIFTLLDIGHFPFWDPSIIIGLAGAVGLVAASPRKNDNRMYIFIPLLFNSLLFMMIAPVEAYGWYKYSLYPLMAIGLGYVFFQLYKQRVAWYILFLPLLGLMLQNSGLVGNQFGMRLIVIIIYLLLLLSIIFRDKFLHLREVFLPLLFLLFVFEIVWTLRVLGIVMSL